MSAITLLANKLKTPKNIDLLIEDSVFTDKLCLVDWANGVYQNDNLKYAAIFMDYSGEFVSIFLEYKRTSELTSYLKKSLLEMGVSQIATREVSSTVRSKDRLVGSSYVTFKFFNGCELLIALHSD